MTYILNLRPTFVAPVVVRIPGEPEQTFSAVFTALPVDEYNGFDLSSEAGAREFLQAAVSGLDDIIDAGKKPIPYSEELRDALIGAPLTRGALLVAYNRAIAEAIRGNSSGLPAPGPQAA